MGWEGGVFGTQNTKVTCTLLYNKGGVSIFYPESQKYKWYFCTPAIAALKGQYMGHPKTCQNMQNFDSEI